MKKKSSTTPAPTLKTHFLRDFSLEMARPPIVNPQKGEQELQFSLSMHRAPGTSSGEYEVLLASRLVIWHTPSKQPLVVAYHAYTGMFHNENAQIESVEDAFWEKCLEMLYPLASDSIKQHLKLEGHMPPLPKVMDLNNLTNKP